MKDQFKKGGRLKITIYQTICNLKCREFKIIKEKKLRLLLILRIRNRMNLFK